MKAMEDVLIDQLEVLKKLMQKKYVNRELKLSKTNLIQVVLGIRRSGKSFFIAHYLKGKNFGYIDFDDPRIKYEGIIDAFYKAYGDVEIVFLDEVQEIHHWERIAEFFRKRGHKVFITGSNSMLLKPELATRLTGRHISYQLYPFSFREFVKAKNIENRGAIGRAKLINLLRSYLIKGGFPEVVVENEIPELYARELISNILTKDIIGKNKIKYKATLSDVFFYIVENFASLVSISAIRKKYKIGSDHTVKNYLKLMQDAFVIHFIEQFSYKPHIRKSMPFKAYIADPSFIISIKDINTGKRMENIVGVDLLRRKSYWNNLWEIFYWRDYQQREVDFVIKERNRVKELIQVTYASGKDEIERRELRGLKKASELFKCKNMKVITWDYEDVSDGIEFIPLWKWLIKSNL